MRKGGAVRNERTVLLLLIVLLASTVVAPIFFFANNFSPSAEENGFVDDKSSTAKHASTEALELRSTEQGGLVDVREPEREIFEDDGAVHSGTSDGGGARVGDGVDSMLLKNATSLGKVVDEPNHVSGDTANGPPNPPLLIYETIREMKDQLILAKAYLNFAPPNSNSHLVRELKLRIKEIERIIGQANKDSDLSRSALQRKKAMEDSLAKAGKIYPDCSAMAAKLRSMTHNTEGQLRAQSNQASYLMQLAARTFPKGLHCLSMHLTAEYFELQLADRELPNREKVKLPNLYHYAIFSDNVLSTAVVVNSTIRASKDLDKIVFHIVTDALNYPAMRMWFLINPPGKATVSVENIDDFKWYNSSYSSMAIQPGVKDPRFLSELNYLRFYMPQIFPYLDKILLLDHDVVVQRDLSKLWTSKMNGKVIGAVERCGVHDSDLRLEKLADFSDPDLSAKFEKQTCVWAFGMNIFDLREWRRQRLTSAYHKLLQVSKRKRILKAGSLPLGQLVFYNRTLLLDRHWHVHGLGHDPSIGRGEIEKAAVIHFDGIMKPWLEIGLARYKRYWTKFINYDLPYLQQCNIHP